jgi:hypothetical protein
MFIPSMSLISKAFAPDSIFGRDNRQSPRKEGPERYGESSALLLKPSGKQLFFPLISGASAFGKSWSLQTKRTAFVPIS